MPIIRSLPKSLVVLLLSCSAFITLGSALSTQQVFALASPGCYELRAGDQLYHLVSCTGDMATDVHNNGACYSKTIIPKQQSDFKKIDCNSIPDNKIYVTEVPGGFRLNPAGSCRGSSGECIADDIQLIINVLSIGVGTVVTGVIIFGGLQYMLSRDNAQAVQAAKTRIMNAVVAFIAYIFVWAFLQWVVPGGLF